MPDVPIGVQDRAEIGRRAEAQFLGKQRDVYRSTDRLFADLLSFQWFAGVALALLVSPTAWAGSQSRVHSHVWAAVFLGAAVVSLPIGMTLTRPGALATRHVVAVGQALMGSLLIHLTGGRIETHFHIFGSLALLSFYRDWRVLVTFSAVVAADHFVRGVYWPQSVFGVLVAGRWRWLEHTAWVAFEDTFLIRSCVQGVREMHAIAFRQASLEVTREGIERKVRERTAAMEEANRSLAAEIAERARVESALRESDTRFRSLSACSPIGIFTTDQNSGCTYANPTAESIAGLTFEEARGHGWHRFVHRDDLDRVIEAWQDCCRDATPLDVVYRYNGPKGEVRWARVRASPMSDENGQFKGHVGTIEDTTDRKRAEEHLEFQATHDALTGLPNRALFQRSLDGEVTAAREAGGRFALLLIDLDRFKEINDTFGHHCGDAVLQQLKPRLRRALRSSDFIARLGGDEFAVILPDADEAGATTAATRILEELRRPIVTEGRELDVGASIGIVLYPEQAEDAVKLFCHADSAMYTAKREHGGFAVYSPAQAENDPRRLSMVSELRQGIEGGQLVLYYQPKVSARTGRVEGAEALVRWRHPREGLMAPDSFIPLAEHTGLIKPLGVWVLKDALRQGRLWHLEGLPLSVAVNLAPKNLQDPQLLQTIMGHFGDRESLLSGLTLEITESAMMAEPEETREVLARLHERGIRISIDDFGTGYSSLAYLQTLPVDEIKIDRCFVKESSRGGKGACIVRSVIDLGHSLGLRVVAEGVEDHQTFELLADWGCDVAQGYYFSRPLPVDELRAWLADAEAAPWGRPPAAPDASGATRGLEWGPEPSAVNPAAGR